MEQKELDWKNVFVRSTYFKEGLRGFKQNRKEKKKSYVFSPTLPLQLFGGYLHPFFFSASTSTLPST